MTARTIVHALRAINRNKVRAALTMLGVIIGVAAVIAMVAIGSGATASVQQQIASMGQNLINVRSGSSSSGAVQYGAGTNPTLTPADAEAIARECPSAAAVSIIVRARGQMIYQNVNWAPDTLQGCDPSFLKIRDWEVESGEPFTEQDVRLARQVCLVGKTVADRLFGEDDPVGKRVRVKNLPFEVVGVLAKKGANTFGSDQDDVILMPWTTTKKKLQGSTFQNIDQLMVSATSAAAMPRLEEEIKAALRASHRIPRNSRGEWDDDFSLRNMTEIMDAMTSTTRIMTGLLAAIASISLVVGGIGIMNIMLVSVTERTREIGLRMAVGARGRDILAQFLVEAVLLSGMGGLAGIALGGGASLAVASVFRWPAIISPATIVVAVLFSAAVGCFFGFYPAWRASRLDPIEALRYE